MQQFPGTQFTPYPVMDSGDWPGALQTPYPMVDSGDWPGSQQTPYPMVDSGDWPGAEPGYDPTPYPVMDSMDWPIYEPTPAPVSTGDDQELMMSFGSRTSMDMVRMNEWSIVQTLVRIIGIQRCVSCGDPIKR